MSIRFEYNETHSGFVPLKPKEGQTHFYHEDTKSPRLKELFVTLC